MQSNVFNLCKRTFSFDLRFAALKALIFLCVAGMIWLQEWSRRKKPLDLGCLILFNSSPRRFYYLLCGGDGCGNGCGGGCGRRLLLCIVVRSRTSGKITRACLHHAIAGVGVTAGTRSRRRMSTACILHVVAPRRALVAGPSPVPHVGCASSRWLFATSTNKISFPGC